MKVLISRAIGDDGKALWEDYFPLVALEEKRREAGRIIFGLQYQNDASLASGAIFRKSDFRHYERMPEGLLIYQGVDLAIGRSEGADYFAMVTVGVCRGDGSIYVIDSFRDKLGFRGQIEVIRDRAARYEPRRIGIESVAYQAALAGYLEEEGVLPIKRVRPMADKLRRSWGLQGLFESHMVFFGVGDRELEEELTLFPDGGHDDLFDAFEIAVSLGRMKSGGKLKHIPGL